MFSILPLMDNTSTSAMGENTIVIDTPENINIDFITLKKMGFIYNAIETGWSVKKKEDTYIFSKKHEGKKEVYLESYLRKFIETNMKMT
jgi:hypothetical protein